MYAGQAVKSRKGYTNRQQLIAAAIEVGGKVGLRALNVSLITGETGLSRASFYTYFQSVEELIEAAVAASRQEIESTLSVVHEQKQRGARRMALCIYLLFQKAKENPAWGRFASEVFEEVDDARPLFLEAVRPEITAALERGEFSLEKNDAEPFLNLVLDACVSQMRRLASKGTTISGGLVTIKMLLRAAGMPRAKAEKCLLQIQVAEGRAKGRSK